MEAGSSKPPQLPQLPQVLMPWALERWPDASLEPDQEEEEEEEDEKASHSLDSFALRAPPAPLGARSGRPATTLGATRGGAARTITSVTDNWPRIPEDDRRPVGDEARVSVAVLLDVLSTWTKELTAKQTILADLATTLCRLSAPEEKHARDDIRSLIAAAATEAASTRVVLCLRIRAALATSGLRDVSMAPGASCSPESAAAALRRIEKMATIVVREVRLVLEAREPMDYRQA